MTTKSTFIADLEKAIKEKGAIVTNEKGVTTFDHTKVAEELKAGGFDHKLLEQQNLLSGQVATAVAAAYSTTDLKEFMDKGPTADRTMKYKLGGQTVTIHQWAERSLNNPSINESKVVKGYTKVNMDAKHGVQNDYFRKRVSVELELLAG